MLGVDGIGSPEDHDAFLEVGKAIPILGHRASFLGCCLLAFSFFWPTSLSQEALEELIVLIEVLDGVSMVGALVIHELVKVIGLALLGLFAHAMATTTNTELASRCRSFLFFLPLYVEGPSS